jgi:hypothetical protein
MKDIHEVLRQKQSKYAALGKQIEMLQQAAEKLREVAPLLAENDDEDNAVLIEVDAFRGGQGHCGVCGRERVQGSPSHGASLAIISPWLGGESSYDPSGVAGFH